MATPANNPDVLTGCGICGAEFCTHQVCRQCGDCPVCDGGATEMPTPTSPLAEQERLRQKAMERRRAIHELALVVCACGAKKKDHQSFCRSCYRSLPAEIQTGLYLDFSRGYIEWWRKAHEHLRASGRIEVRRAQPGNSSERRNDPTGKTCAP